MIVNVPRNWTSRPVTTLPPACNVIWTESDDFALSEYAAQGRSRKEIAELLGRTVMGIQGRCQKMGIHLRRDAYGGAMAPRDYERSHNETRAHQEARDRRFVRALALSLSRGEHLPGDTNAQG